MPRSHFAPLAKPPSGRHLSFVEREEIALLRAGGHGVREIARQLGRAPSTISLPLALRARTRCAEARAQRVPAHGTSTALGQDPACVAAASPSSRPRS